MDEVFSAFPDKDLLIHVKDRNLEAIPRQYQGYVWTNRIDRISSR